MGNPMRNGMGELRLERQAGSALVVTLLFLTVLMLLASALIFFTQGEMKSGAAYKRSQQAFYVASAGVQKAVAWFNDTSVYNPYTPSTAYDRTTLPVKFSNQDVVLAGQGGSSVYPDGTVSSSFSGQLANQSLTADTNSSGVYAVNASLRRYIPVTFINPTTFISTPSGVERWSINSIGYWGSVANPLGMARVTATIENSGDALMDRALWGIDSVDLTGTTFVDSYDPALGPYGVGGNVGYGGSVGTNGVLSAGGTTTVNGDLLYGPGGSYSGGSNVTVTGSIIQAQEPHVFEPVPTITAGSGNLNYSGGTPTLGPGTYGGIRLVGSAVLELTGGTYYIDSLDIGGGALLKVTARTTLFVKNDINAGGNGILNTTGIPDNLMIFCSGDDVKLSGTSDFYGSVYAPNASLDITGTTNLFGAYVGLTVKNNGTANIHFDEGSLHRNLLRQPYRIITWAQDIF